MDSKELFNKLLDILSGEPSKCISLTSVDGLEVSTVITPDLGPETAIIDQQGVYPVERYVSVEDAMLGHERWCKYIVGKQEVVYIANPILKSVNETVYLKRIK